MKRSPSLIAWTLAIAAGMVLPSIATAQAEKPVVAVLYFDNNSIGKDRADYDGLGKGIADLLITDLAGNPNVTVVERERIQQVLQEHQLIKAGAIDNQTAVEVGKIVGAQYMITGGFINTGKGQMVLTARAINVKTSQITNPEKVMSKDDDALGLVAQLSAKMQKDMRLPALRVGDASEMQHEMKHDDAPKHEDAMKHDDAPKSDAAAAKHDAPAKTEVATAKHDAPKSEPAPRQAGEQASAKSSKLDWRTAVLYSKALEETDSGNNTKAAELYRAVLAKFPDFGPAKSGYAKVSKHG